MAKSTTAKQPSRARKSSGIASRAQQSKQPKPDVRYGRGFRSIGKIAEPTIRDTCKSYGFTHLPILQNWHSIAGQDLAGKCRPVRVKVDRRGNRTLYVLAQGACATEIEYTVPLLLERIATACGCRAVDNIRVTQIGKLVTTQHAPVPVPPPPSPPTDEDRRLVGQSVASIGNADLRDALHRLGLAIRARKSARRVSST